MNLNPYRPISKADEILLSITKLTDFPIQQTKTKTTETLEIKINTAIKTFFSDTPLSSKDDQ